MDCAMWIVLIGSIGWGAGTFLAVRWLLDKCGFRPEAARIIQRECDRKLFCEALDEHDWEWHPSRFRIPPEYESPSIERDPNWVSSN